jgi:hypothetical protein
MQASRIAEADIAQRAYALWLEEGCPDGRDQEHWERATQELESAPSEPEEAGAAPVSAASVLTEPEPEAAPKIAEPEPVPQPAEPKKRATRAKKPAAEPDGVAAAAATPVKKPTRRKSTPSTPT